MRCRFTRAAWPKMFWRQTRTARLEGLLATVNVNACCGPMHGCVRGKDGGRSRRPAPALRSSTCSAQAGLVFLDACVSVLPAAAPAPLIGEYALHIHC